MCGRARWANQLVAIVLVESASQRPRAVNAAGMEGSSPDRMSKPGSPSVRLSVANAHVGSGAIGVCASPTLGRLTVQLDTRCNGWNRWPQSALARSPAAKTLVTCTREASCSKASAGPAGGATAVAEARWEAVSASAANHHWATVMRCGTADVLQIMFACVDCAPAWADRPAAGPLFQRLDKASRVKDGPRRMQAGSEA